MKWLLVVALFAVAFADEEDDGLEAPLADTCDLELCKLPNCLCSSTSIPGGLEARDTPQFVTLTFDDGVNVINMPNYRNLLYNRRNSNGCPAGTTFYVNHEYTNYQLVNELYNNGFEIALHSISHQTPQTYWAEGTYDDMVKEFGHQTEQMARFANIPIETLSGLRSPFLQLAGNNTFHVIKGYGLKYDCSWPTITHINPPLWPYTLDYASTQDCPIPPCPSASIPGVWVQPMVSWRDLNDVACSMADGCFSPPPLNDENAWYNFILQNFERHYLSNRAPFGFYIHEWYIASNPAVWRALVRFLDLINRLNDAFMVNSDEVLEWVKNPVPINEYIQKPCRTFVPTSCGALTCPVRAEHNDLEYWMAICNDNGACPRVYPWLGNPEGL